MDLIWWFYSLAIGFGILLIFRFVSSTRRISSQGKAVLITGCDSGFGHLLAQRLADLGYKVFAGCLSIREEGAQNLKSYSPNIVIIPLDVTDDRSVKDSANFVCEQLEGRDMWAIVNNAGITHVGEMEWTPFETIFNVFNVNAFGTVRVTQRFLPHLKKSKGRIVNVTSISAERRFVGFVGYSMSKAAAKSFNDVIRLELRKWGIKVINIAPYFYGTRMNDFDRIKHLINDSWERSDSQNRAEIRRDYCEDFTRIASKFNRIITNPHVEEVVDSMEDAITSVSPKICYRPGNLLNKFVIDIPNYLPSSLEDYIQSLFLPSAQKK